jgi:hypothetical protein
MADFSHRNLLAANMLMRRNEVFYDRKIYERAEGNVAENSALY